jgi:P27 family predicted phage terminase small subunit
MAKRGRPPKPPEQRLLEGNPGKRPVPEVQDDTDQSFGALRMPQRLTEDERAVWQGTLSCFPDWYFTRADAVLLTTYCRAVVRLEKSEKALHTSAAVEKKSNGSRCVNPHMTVINTTLAQVIQLSNMLGLSKATRKGILTPPPQGEVNNTSLGGEEPEFEDGLIALPVTAQSG